MKIDELTKIRFPSTVFKLIHRSEQIPKRCMSDIDRVSRLSRRWYKLNFTTEWTEKFGGGSKGVKSGNANGKLWKFVEWKNSWKCWTCSFRFEFKFFTISTKYFLIIITTHRLNWGKEKTLSRGLLRILNCELSESISPHVTSTKKHQTRAEEIWMKFSCEKRLRKCSRTHFNEKVSDANTI